MGVIYLGSNGAQGIYLNILNAIGQRKWASIGIIADSFIKLTLVAAILNIYESNAFTVIHAIAISSLLAFFLMRQFCKKFSSQLPMNENQRVESTKMLLYLSLPLVAPSLLTALKGASDKVLMAFFIGVEELAASATTTGWSM